MKVPVSWLKEFCPTDRSVDQLADLLGARGATVESVSYPWANLEGVVVARVLEVKDHPSSDKLCLARIDIGSGHRGVVVGVRNMAPDDLVPYAGPGSRVPALPEPLTVREIRGERSEGMLCSPRELGISGDHTAILVLREDVAVGSDVKEAFGLDDAVLDVEVTPNRPDFLSMVGLAREVAGATGVPLVIPAPDLAEGTEPASASAAVEVRDLERCSRYLARVIRGVSVGPAPIRAQARLTACGMRPVSNVVDATNYVMLERGQPMHPFDLDRLAGAAIVVRRADEGERLVTLDDVERVLSSEDLLIADAEKGVAIAGVMGSAWAEVSSGTTVVLLESAHFDRTGVLRTARRLELQTEASIRFERGTDPEAVPGAAARAAQLIVEWSGGAILSGEVLQGSAPSRRRVRVRPRRAAHLLGYPVSRGDAEAVFRQLDMTPVAHDGEIEVEVPGYRVDIEAEVDLIEEVARVQGYDRIGSELPAIRQAGGVPATYDLRRQAREALVRAGLRETWSYSFASQADLQLMGDVDAVRVANPLAGEDVYLRISLVPGLLRALQTNLSRQADGAALFEVGRVFRLGEPIEEQDHAGLVMAGTMVGFPGEDRAFDFFDAKGAIEAVVEALRPVEWGLGEPLGEPFHPGRSAIVTAAGRAVGVLGELHPRVAAEHDLPGRTLVAEIALPAAGEWGARARASREVYRFPPARRDLAWMVDADVRAGRVQEVIREAAGAQLESCRLFDVFEGAPVPPGKKSLAFSLSFRAPERTLTDEEVDAAVASIDQRVAAEVGGELRAG